EIPSQPAFSGDVFGVGRLPNVHRLEVGEVGVGVADALYDREVAPVESVLEVRQAGMEGDPVVDGDHVALFDADAGTVLTVSGVVVRDDGVEAVDPASKLDDDKSLPGKRGLVSL